MDYGWCCAVLEFLSHDGKYVDKFDIKCYNTTMSSYIDTKFLNLLSNRLTNFKQKKARSLEL